MILERNPTLRRCVIFGTICAGFLMLAIYFQHNELREVPEQLNALRPAGSTPIVNERGNAADGQY